MLRLIGLNGLSVSTSSVMFWFCNNPDLIVGYRTATLRMRVPSRYS